MLGFMHNQPNRREMQNPKRWSLTLYAKDTSPTVVTVSNADANWAILNLMYSHDTPAEQVFGETSALTSGRAAQ